MCRVLLTTAPRPNCLNGAIIPLFRITHCQQHFGIWVGFHELAVHATGWVVHRGFVELVSIWVGEDTFPVRFPCICINPLLEVGPLNTFEHVVTRPIQQLLQGHFQAVRTCAPPTSTNDLQLGSPSSGCGCVIAELARECRGVSWDSKWTQVLWKFMGFLRYALGISWLRILHMQAPSESIRGLSQEACHSTGGVCCQSVLRLAPQPYTHTLSLSLPPSIPAIPAILCPIIFGAAKWLECQAPSSQDCFESLPKQCLCGLWISLLMSKKPMRDAEGTSCRALPRQYLCNGGVWRKYG